MLWLDEYERRARLVPGLLAVLPIGLAILALGLRRLPIFSTLLSAATAVGGPVVLASFVRQRGQRLQERLFQEWGGSPTIDRLRLLDHPPTDARRSRRRQKLEDVTNTPLPSVDEERANPGA